jgi:hypothetical protein
MTSVATRIMIADLRKTNPHAAMLIELLGIARLKALSQDFDTRLEFVTKLRLALKNERARGKSGSFYYDVNRHINLIVALRNELAGLATAFEHEQKAETGAKGLEKEEIDLGVQDS